MTFYIKKQTKLHIDFLLLDIESRSKEKINRNCFYRKLLNKNNDVILKWIDDIYKYYFTLKENRPLLLNYLASIFSIIELHAVEKIIKKKYILRNIYGESFVIINEECTICHEDICHENGYPSCNSTKEFLTWWAMDGMNFHFNISAKGKLVQQLSHLELDIWDHLKKEYE